jgi:hypothetical protein
LLYAANDSALAWGAGAIARRTYVERLQAISGNVRKFVLYKAKDGKKELKSYSLPGAESEGKYGARIRAELITGKDTVAKLAHVLKLPTGKANDEKIVDAALQSFAETLSVHGYDDKGVAKPSPTTGKVEHIFNADLKLAEKSKKVEALAQRYKDSAINIITNGNEAKWVDTFAKEKIEHSTFTTPAKGTDDEQAAIKATNHLNLAYAIKAREQKKNEEAEKKRQTEYQ